jgi:hypothetical protein
MILAHITPADASTPPADTDPPVTPATRLPFFLYFDLRRPPLVRRPG